jgi:hypothetical protein
VNEIPHRAVIDLQAALTQLGDKSPQREVPFRDPLQQPGAVLAGDRLRLVTAHLARRNIPGSSELPNPANRRPDRYSKLRRRLPPRHSASNNRRNNPLTQIKRIGSRHLILASSPASTLNQNPADSRIPKRIRPNSSRSRKLTALS